MLIAMKFGGTSVGSAERIAQAAQLATNAVDAGHQVVIVTSAMSRVTNTLIDTAREAATGRWDPLVREQLFERHRVVADALVGGDSAALAPIIEALNRHLDRFEKLCFGLSM